ncbi:hypothetical protein D3C84_661600 [compost metagenome]
MDVEERRHELDQVIDITARDYQSSFRYQQCDVTTLIAQLALQGLRFDLGTAEDFVGLEPLLVYHQLMAGADTQLKAQVVFGHLDRAVLGEQVMELGSGHLGWIDTAGKTLLVALRTIVVGGWEAVRLRGAVNDKTV